MFASYSQTESEKGKGSAAGLNGEGRERTSHLETSTDETIEHGTKGEEGSMWSFSSRQRWGGGSCFSQDYISNIEEIQRKRMKERTVHHVISLK